MRRAVVACAALAACWVLSLARLMAPGSGLPELGGPYPVAKHRWVLHSQRQDVHDPNPFAEREFLVTVYYPTLVSGEMEPAPYLSRAAVDAALSENASATERFFARWGVPRLRSRAWTGSGSGLSPVRHQYPVVIFSPGLGWPAEVHSYYLEQLASHGYAVFAITHPGQTRLVEYPDGRVSRSGWSALALTEDKTASERRDLRYEALRSTLIKELDEGKAPSLAQVRELMALNVSTTLSFPLSVRKEDVVELLDRLQALNAGTPVSQFAGRLDMENIAITGMSYGGPTASEVCLEDARCKVVVNMDGEEFGRLPLEAGTRPALWLFRMSRWEGTPQRRVAYQNYAGPAFRVGFEGAEHGTFSDQPYWPARVSMSDILLLRGLRNGSRRKDRKLPPLILQYQLDFLDHYLKGRELRYLRRQPARGGVKLDFRNVPGNSISDPWAIHPTL